MTPNEYRKLGDKNIFLKKLKFDSEYLKHINNKVSLEPEMYTQKSMLLIGLKTLFYSVDSEKNNISEKLPAIWDNFLARVGEINNTVSSTCYGVIQQARKNTDQLEYYAAIQVGEIAELPHGMISIDIKQSNYAKFTHKGKVENIDNTVNYIYGSWMLQSGKEHTTDPDLEIYGEKYEAASDKSIIHYAIPIK